jgi:hypothetical protein
MGELVGIATNKEEGVWQFKSVSMPLCRIGVTEAYYQLGDGSCRGIWVLEEIIVSQDAIK